MVKYMEVDLKISTTCPFSMLDNFLMSLVEVDPGLGPALLLPIIQVIMLYHMVFIVMVIKEVEIGITSDNFLHTTMVD